MDDIHSTFDELQKTLNVRKSVLLMELEVNYGLKHKVRLSPLHTLSGHSRHKEQQRTQVGPGLSLLASKQSRSLSIIKFHFPPSCFQQYYDSMAQVPIDNWTQGKAINLK